MRGDFPILILRLDHVKAPRLECPAVADAFHPIRRSAGGLSLAAKCLQHVAAVCLFFQAMQPFAEEDGERLSTQRFPRYRAVPTSHLWTVWRPRYRPSAAGRLGTTCGGGGFEPFPVAKQRRHAAMRALWTAIGPIKTCGSSKVVVVLNPVESVSRGTNLSHGNSVIIAIMFISSSIDD